MKRKVKSTFTVAIVAALAAIGYVSYTQHQDNQFIFANPLMEENIEALSTVSESNGGGIEVVYCAEYHSTSMLAYGNYFKCKDGTVMTPEKPKTPMGNIYPCIGPKGKTTVLAKMGYCYISK